MENNVICRFCKKEFYLKPSRIKRAKYNYCSQSCNHADKSNRHSGNENPNCRYHYDEDFFNEIDTEFKAWFLGWIFGDGGIAKTGRVVINIHQKDIDVLKMFQNGFINKPLSFNHERKMSCYSFNSKKMVAQIKKFMGISNPACFKISENIAAVEGVSGQMIRHFVRGLFESDGHLRKLSSTRRYPELKITSRSKPMLEWVQQHMEIPSNILVSEANEGLIYDLYYYGVGVLDFLAKIYDDTHYKLIRKYNQYIDIVNWSPRIPGPKVIVDNVKISRFSKDAVVPTKAHGSDSGYDLTIISKVKTFNGCVLYDTGISVEPPHGFYFDVVPRSSITKTGYVLANSVGIIDRSYVGSIKIALYKLDKDAPDIELPCKIAQMILRPTFHFELKVVDKLSDSQRGEGGFGSTGRM